MTIRIYDTAVGPEGRIVRSLNASIPCTSVLYAERSKEVGHTDIFLRGGGGPLRYMTVPIPIAKFDKMYRDNMLTGGFN